MEEHLDTTEFYINLDAEVEKIASIACENMQWHSKEFIHSEIFRAYNFAKKAHEGQKRHSGEPYISHPVAAVRELLVVKPDLVTIQACFLHDVPEDTSISNEEIEKEFGEEVAFITQGMEKIGKIKYRWEERQIQNMRKTFVYMAKDPRLILVKFADRIHNLKTLHHHPNIEKRKRIALETLEIYSPIADRLGVYSMREILENESFHHLLPEEYEKIVSELNEMHEIKEHFLATAGGKLREALKDSNIACEISCRMKLPYSIYRKMRRKGYEHVQSLSDIFGMRIVTDTEAHCYEILSIIHANWQPIFLRIKDYIGKEKENGYQSLHTTVVGMFPFRVEVQIRTKEMHERAEIGIAAHFTYAESGKSLTSQHEIWINHLREALKHKKDSDFLEEIRSIVLQDSITVFTPKGETIILPVESTPIDFAYSIHSDIGNHAKIALVDGAPTSLTHKLVSGNVIEIVVDKNSRPQEFWIACSKTHRAKQCIRSYLFKNKRPELVESGRKILEEYLLKNAGYKLDKKLSVLDNIGGRKNGTKEKEEILAQLGSLMRKPSSIFSASSEFKHKKETESPSAQKNENSSTPKNLQPPRIIIGEQEGLPWEFAPCCHPQEKRNIAAVARKNGTIHIHEAHCKTLHKVNPKRILPAFWEFMQSRSTLLRAQFFFEKSTSSLVTAINIFGEMRVDIHETSMKEKEGNIAALEVVFEMKDENYYIFEYLLEKMRLEIPGFIEGRLIDIR